jgi:hypothetical protein
MRLTCFDSCEAVLLCTFSGLSCRYTLLAAYLNNLGQDGNGYFRWRAAADG